MIQTLCLLPTSFKLQHLKPMSGPAKEYADNDIRFYQLFSLSFNFGLHHALCATRRLVSDRPGVQRKRYQIVLVPTVKDKLRSKFKGSSHFIEDDFIVPDGLEEVEDTLNLSKANPHTLGKHNVLDRGWRRLLDDKVMSINARRLFEVSFMGADVEENMEDHDPEDMARYIRNINLDVETRKDQDHEGLATL